MALLRSFLRLLGTVGFTVVEAATLVVWLALVRGSPMGSDLALLGAAVLVVGLVGETLINAVVVNGTRGLSAVRIVAFSVTEAVIWVVWLVIAEQVGGLAGVGVAAVALFVLMVPQHSVEDSALRGERVFRNLFKSGTVLFTLIEALGATIWLALVVDGDALLTAVGVDVTALLASLPVAVSSDPITLGIAVLTVALLVEHVIGLQFALRGEASTAAALHSEVVNQT